MSFFSRKSLHTAAEPAVPSAVKILVSERNDTITSFFFAASKNKYNEQVPLASTSSLLEYSGLNWRGTAYFVQNNTTIILPGDTRRTTSERRPIFGAKIEALKHKMVHIFHFFPTHLVFEIVNSFSWIFSAISSEKNYLLLTLHQDTRIFPACWMLIGQFKFPARQRYARILW